MWRNSLSLLLLLGLFLACSFLGFCGMSVVLRHSKKGFPHLSLGWIGISKSFFSAFAFAWTSFVGVLNGK